MIGLRARPVQLRPGNMMQPAMHSLVLRRQCQLTHVRSTAQRQFAESESSDVQVLKYSR